MTPFALSWARRFALMQSTSNATPEPDLLADVPIKVVVADAEAGVIDVSAEHPGGGRYRGLWVLARTGGEARALVKLRFGAESTNPVDAGRILADLGVGEPAQARPPLSDPPPSMSVIVPTMLSRGADVENCVRSISQIDYPDYEVLLVYTAAEDIEPPAWLAEFPAVRLLRESAPGVSAARNRGLAEARGEIAAFTDDDTLVDPSWLRIIARRLGSHPEEVGLTGLVIPGQIETESQLTLERYYRDTDVTLLEPVSYRLAAPRSALRLFTPAKVNAWNDDGVVVHSLSVYEGGRLGGGNNMAFRTRELREAGGFDVRLGAGTLGLAGEDIELYSRLIWRGHSLARDPSALVLHVHRREEDALRKQIEAYGVGLSAAAVALAFDDPRHVGAIAGTVPRAIRLLVSNFWGKLRPRGDRAAGSDARRVPELARVEMRGMLEGPWAFLRSRRRVRRAGR